MLTSNDLKLLWQEDCLIDDTNLQEAVALSPRLHSRYLNYMIDCKKELMEIETRAKKIRAALIRYYSGKMSKEELMERGWNQYQETKPLKGEMETLIDIHPTFEQVRERILDLELMISMLESIIKMIFARSYDIKTLIEIRKFEFGC